MPVQIKQLRFDFQYLYYCRWVLLQFKREFPYEDALKVFEIVSSHHLELSSMEAEKARNMERRKDFELQGRNPS